MRIDLPAVLKAGLAGALLGVILGLLTAIPTFVGGADFLFGLLLCCGGAFVPLLAGLLYGYFAPGDETPSQAAVGGALAGFATGALYAVFQALVSLADLVIAGDRLREIFTAGQIPWWLACCLSLLVGPLLGALGGAIWVSRQNRTGKLGV